MLRNILEMLWGPSEPDANYKANKEFIETKNKDEPILSKSQIYEKLKERLLGAKCPCCSHDKFIFLDKFTYISCSDETTMGPLSCTQYVPSTAIVCKKCGNMQFFSISRLWEGFNSSWPESKQEKDSKDVRPGLLYEIDEEATDYLKSISNQYLAIAKNSYGSMGFLLETSSTPEWFPLYNMDKKTYKLIRAFLKIGK